MLSSPYPVPSLRLYRVALTAGWAFGVIAGVWVLIDPPDSYEGLGAALTTAWGVMLTVGSALCAIANGARRYQLEIPGLILALGGIAIYDYLSWQATFTDSLGSGPRSCLTFLLGMFVVARIRVLLSIDRQARKLADMRCDE